MGKSPYLTRLMPTLSVSGCTDKPPRKKEIVNDTQGLGHPGWCKTGKKEWRFGEKYVLHTLEGVHFGSGFYFLAPAKSSKAT